ncbi:MAG: penicillin-binding transpeptidase domain-containing protein [Tissierellia bacterium]|nr:penicillin-binding transpeptidase domain-containing protein [Tissierellia bacterium]
MKQRRITQYKRYRLFNIIIVISMTILLIKLASLTIAHGDYYRNISENKRVREIFVTAPRGEIRDRNGRLLAGNKPMFSVQILKDEISNRKSDNLENNKYMRNLISILEEDAINYSSDFPLVTNQFIYENTSDYLKTELSPFDRIVEIIINNNLIEPILQLKYQTENEWGKFTYLPARAAINALEFQSENLPLEANIIGDEIKFDYKDNVNIESWLKEHGYSVDIQAKELVLNMIDNNEIIVKKVLENPISRGLIYTYISQLGKIENIRLEAINFKYEKDFLEQKRAYMNLYPEINMDTSAEQDFLIILKENSLYNLLIRTIEEEQEIIPIKELLEIVQSEGDLLDYKIKIEENKPIIVAEESNLPQEELVNSLINYASKDKRLNKFINLDGIGRLAQIQMIEDGINTKISVSNGYEYTSIRNLNNWLKSFKLEEKATANEALEKIRETYDLPKSLSKYEIIGIASIRNEISKQGDRAYAPINFAYGLKDSTVAKIEEQLSIFQGFQISVEPVRYYPNGKTAAHLLGYMGKISQQNEIDKYITEGNYGVNALIGKTGLEQSFEDELCGVNGRKKIEVDAAGNTTELIEEEEPIPGDAVFLSIDLQLQKEVDKLLDKTLRTIREGGIYHSKWGDYQMAVSKDKGRPYVNATSGAVMVTDVETGQVLAMSSFPSYDPNLFATGISNADWESLIPKDEKDHLAPRPLRNVATQTSIQTGSTFKMVTGLAALEKGFGMNETIDDMGYVEIGDHTFNCLLYTQSEHSKTHGRLNLAEAIRDSCNFFFYTLALGENQHTGERLSVKLNIDDITSMAAKLGLDRKTGLEINIPAEVSNGVPDPDKKIATQKALLKQWVINNIDDFYVGEEDYNSEIKNNIVEEIVSWADLETPITRREVVTRLSYLNLNPEKKLPNSRNSLADIITYTYLKEARWTMADTLNITIGQGYNAYTLAQMSNYVSTISNGGYIHKLSLIDSIKNFNNSKETFKHVPNAERIDMKNYEHLKYIMKGMNMASKTSANQLAFKDFPIEVGIKTGTAEKSGINPVTGDTYDSFAYEVGFAPYDKPKIAVSILIFQGGAGSNCTPLMRDIIGQYMGLNRIEEKDPIPLEKDFLP